MGVHMSTISVHSSKFETEEQRWQAVKERDSAADGFFVYAVKTTGVYARPSSAARLPNFKNVIFFDSAEKAEAAGYRASRHNAGDQSKSSSRWAEVITTACRFIESSDPPPTLTDLSEHVGMSPAYLH